MHEGIEHMREQRREEQQKERRNRAIDHALRLSEARSGDNGTDDTDEDIVDYAQTFYNFMEGDSDE